MRRRQQKEIKMQNEMSAEERSAALRAKLQGVNAESKDVADLMRAVIEAPSNEQMVALFKAYDAKVTAVLDKLVSARTLLRRAPDGEAPPPLRRDP